MSAYRIKHWKSYFEVAQNGACKTLSWIAVPVKHDGKSYRRLMAHPNGPAIYGAWILIAAVAAKCETRGVLVDDGEPLTAEDLHFKTGAPESLFEEALQVLASERIGWLEFSETDPSSVGTQDSLERAAPTLERAAPTLELRDGTGRDGTEQLPVRGAGAFSKRPERKSIFANLTIEDLRNFFVIADWFRVASHREDPIVAFSEANLLNVFGAAVRALRPGKAKKNPVAMFADIVRNGRWQDITQSDEEIARKQITPEILEIAGFGGAAQ